VPLLAPAGEAGVEAADIGPGGLLRPGRWPGSIANLRARILHAIVLIARAWQLDSGWARSEQMQQHTAKGDPSGFEASGRPTLVEASSE